MRPDLNVSFQAKPKSSPKRGADELIVKVSNDGEVTAHNMRCWFNLSVDSFEPWKPKPKPEPQSTNRYGAPMPPMPSLPTLNPNVISQRSWGHRHWDLNPGDAWKRMQVYEEDRILPGAMRTFDVPIIGAFHPGNARIRYTLVCDEGRMETQKEVEIQIPERPTKYKQTED